MNRNYKCNICGVRNVKLWRPEWKGGPLICAECAERQSLNEGTKLNFDEKGTIPVDEAQRSDKFEINVDGIKTKMVPAIPCGKNQYWGYRALTPQRRAEWEKLPLRTKGD